jgi:pseudouridine kinase
LKKEEHVLVIGAAGLDIKARPNRPTEPGTSTPGQIRNSVGGVAHNIAENLARLEVDSVLLTVVGDDQPGQSVLGHAAASGIDVSHVLITDRHRTAQYMAVLDPHGALDFAIHDMAVMVALTPRYLNDQRALFRDARMVVIDANLTPGAMETVVRLVRQYDLPLCADPTTIGLAARLRPHLADLTLVTPNAGEARALTGLEVDPRDRDGALVAARRLVTLGVKTAIIALAEFGVVYAHRDVAGHVPALQTEIVDPTGAGDALTAAVIFGLLENIPLDESVRLGVTAASLTLRSRETVRPDLCLELLYNELVI